MISVIYPFRLRRPITSLKVTLAIGWLAIFTLLAFLPIPGKAIDAYPENQFLPPFQIMANWLGTDQLGRDVFWYLISSAKTAWLLTFPPLVGATLIGISVGTISARFANKPLRFSLASCLLVVFVAISIASLAFAYAHIKEANMASANSFWQLAGVVIILTLSVYYALVKTRLTSFRHTFSVYFPVDELLQRLMDLWTTFPKLLLLLLLSALAPPSLASMGFWIVITYWVLPARLTRTRVLQIRTEPFYESAIALGTPKRKMLLHYLWPSMKGQLMTNFCFNASGLLGIGSTLAFLGIGLPADVPSWGKMLSLARYSVESWWLLLFPAFLLIVSILCLQALGNYFIKSDH